MNNKYLNPIRGQQVSISYQIVSSFSAVFLRKIEVNGISTNQINGFERLVMLIRDRSR